MPNSMKQIYPSINVKFRLYWIILHSLNPYKVIHLIQQIFKYCCVSDTVLHAWNIAVQKRNKIVFLWKFTLVE